MDNLHNLPASHRHPQASRHPGSNIVPASNYRSMRGSDNRYWINRYQWVNWRSNQVKISNDRQSMVGTDGNDMDNWRMAA